jgi:hypothetical protein
VIGKFHFLKFFHHLFDYSRELVLIIVTKLVPLSVFFSVQMKTLTLMCFFFKGCIYMFKRLKLIAAIPTLMFGVMLLPTQAHANFELSDFDSPEFNHPRCVDAYDYSSIGTSGGEAVVNLFFNVYDRYKYGFCDENLSNQGDFYDEMIEGIWGYCVLNLGTSSERGRLANGESNRDKGYKMYPYDGRGGSLKNRKLSARYADHVLERATGDKMKFFIRTTDSILKSRGDWPNLVGIAKKCGAID